MKNNFKHHQKWLTGWIKTNNNVLHCQICEQTSLFSSLMHRVPHWGVEFSLKPPTNKYCVKHSELDEPLWVKVQREARERRINWEKNMTQQLTEKEINRRIEKAQAHLAEIGSSKTFRKAIEETEKINTLEAFWELQDQLSRGFSEHLMNYMGSSDATAFCIRLAEILNGIETPEEKWYRIRENIKDFLKTDEDIPKSETLKKLADEASEEDTMDGYYNLLTSFRKKYDELVKLKKTEEDANNFLARMTGVIYDKK